MMRRIKMNKSMAPTPGNKLLTPANVVTLVRICLVPIFVIALLSPWPEFFNLDPIFFETQSLFAAGIFILISATDWLDGYLARSRNEVTDFGKFMDPLADKILVTAALLALIELGALPSWVVLVILAREFIVSGVRMVAASEGVVIAASWYGKAKTVSQMLAIVLFTIKESGIIGNIHATQGDPLWLFSWFVMIIALILTVVSMLDYISKARHLIGFGRAREKLYDSQSSGSSLEKEADPHALYIEEEYQSVVQGQSESSKGDKRTIARSHSIQFRSFETNNCGKSDLQKTMSECSFAAERVIDMARKRSLTVATAESLTGGMIAQYLTSVPGSSEVVLGGVVSYATAVKERVLEVPSEAILHDGVVSELTAQAMAEGVLSKMEADVSVAVTGIAGPGGGEPGKPVGTVCFGVAMRDGFLLSETKCFEGSREDVRLQTTFHALTLIERMLLSE